MKKYLSIKIIIPDLVHAGQFKEVYRNSVEIDDGIDIPFSKMIETFRFIYNKPDTQIVFGYEL